MQKTPVPHLEAFAQFVRRATSDMMDLIRDTPPVGAWVPNMTHEEASELDAGHRRYKMYEQAYPSTYDQRDTFVTKAINEARHNGEAFLIPKLERLDAAMRGFAVAFLKHPQGNRMPGEVEECYVALAAVEKFIGGRDRTAESRGNGEDVDSSKSKPHAPQDGAFYSSPDLARRYNVDRGRLYQRLRRWRQKNPDGAWIEDPNRKSNDPLYLFRTDAVMHIIDDLLTVGRS